MGKYLLWTLHLADELGALRETFGQKKSKFKGLQWSKKKTTKYIVNEYIVTSRLS